MSARRERAVLFGVIVVALVLNVTGVISPWLALSIQACAVAYSCGVSAQAGRSSRQAIAIATVAAEQFIVDAHRALTEGHVADDEREHVEAMIAAAQEGLAFFDSTAPWWERRRRRRARERASQPEGATR